MGIVQRIIKCLFFILLLFQSSLPLKSAVTYTFSGGRLGDNLLAYCHAKWIACTYDIPLLYRAFPYSDQLMMHVLEEPFLEDQTPAFSKIVIISQVESYSIEPDAGILYIIPYFPESIIEKVKSQYFFSFVVDWNNWRFIGELRKTIFPRNSIMLPSIPNGYKGIALHVRIGTGYDIPSFDDFKTLLDKHPGSELKFPPLTYYIQQIKGFLARCESQKLYIHLFTDHNNPQELIHFFESALSSERVLFGYRAQDNRHDKNILEDFFGITCFDCIIRPDANFALVASKLGEYKVAISPWHCSKINGEYIMDQILMNDQVISAI